MPVSEKKLKDEFPAFVEEMRESRENFAFSEWFGRQLEASGLTTQAQPQAPRGGR